MILGLWRGWLYADTLHTDVSPPGPWDAFTKTDGNLVTGANPASGHVTAEAAVEAYNKL